MSSRSSQSGSHQDALERMTGVLEPKPKRPVAVCVDTTPEGRLNVAYLVGNSIHIFSWDNPKQKPRASKVIQIKEVCSNKWAGVALGGVFLAVWGRPEKGTGALLDARIVISNNESFHLETPPNEIGWFDVDKRVAVSRLGYIALIRHKKLIIVNLNVEPTKTSPTETPRAAQPFTDVAFNDSGDLLYAWATASPIQPSAGLFIYRIDNQGDNRLVSKSYYKPSFNDSFATKLIPYNTHIGCIIAVDNQYYYPAVTGTSLENDTMRQHRYYSEAIRKSYLRASTMYDNHLLIAIQRVGLFQHRYRLVKHPLHLQGGYHCFGGPIELAKVEMKMGGHLEIKAIQFEGHICIFIVNLDGRYEVISLEEAPGFASATEADKESMTSMGDSHPGMATSVG